ncbi:PQQ-binding-like beta-propeller repeat protein [Pontiellaceae bacterium B12227]|nr:PQQ-binding-like beta-propeller repeat protein [Pontiellaceae bacterium B12227]
MAVGGEWTQFRGPTGDGRVSETTKQLPLKWSETENVAWKTAIPHLGWATPVVMDGRIWLTSATEEGNDFYAYCVDAASGKILHEKKLFHCSKPEPLGNSVNCYASPSPAIEPGRVYVHFGSYGTACLDAETEKVIWKRDDMPCRHYRGPGSSAILHDDLLILTFDGVDQQYITALNKKTGKTVWRTDRTTKWNDLGPDGKPKREGDFRKGYTTPLVIEVDGKPRLISPGSSSIFAYEPDTGKEIWKVATPGHTASVSPVFDKGLLLVTTGNGKTEMLGIRPDGKGDVSKTHIEWRFKSKDVPTTPSPVAANGLLFMLGNRGAVTCLDAATGAQIWRERIGGNYQSSPIVFDGRIYCFSVNGKSTVLRAGRTFEQLAENQLDDGFMASPAVDGSALILRTKTHLYRIEK